MKEEVQKNDKVQASIEKLKERDGQEKSPEIDKMYSKQELRNAQQNDSSLDKVR